MGENKKVCEMLVAAIVLSGIVLLVLMFWGSKKFVANRVSEKLASTVQPATQAVSQNAQDITDAARKFASDSSTKEFGRIVFDSIARIIKLAESTIYFHKVWKGVMLGLFFMSVISLGKDFIIVLETPIDGDRTGLLDKAAIFDKASYAVLFFCITYGLIAQKYEQYRLHMISATAAQTESALRDELAKSKLAHINEVSELKQKIVALETHGEQEKIESLPKPRWQNIFNIKRPK
jgi:hypothetical protein